MWPSWGRPGSFTGPAGAVEQLVQTNIDTVAEAGELLAQFEQLWRDRLGRIGDVLAEPERGESR